MGQQLPLAEQKPQQETTNNSSQNFLPCLDSSSECIEKLTEGAIANSTQLITLTEQITLIDQRLELVGERIDYTDKKRWTNYLSADPVRIVQNILGGGDVQRDNLAIADLEVKSAELESARAELQRRQAEVKSKLSSEILTLVLDYEAASRQYSLIESQLASHEIEQRIVEIDYRLGEGSTSQILALTQQREKLENQLVQYQLSQDEARRKLLSVTGFSSGLETTDQATHSTDPDSETTGDRQYKEQLDSQGDCLQECSLSDEQ